MARTVTAPRQPWRLRAMLRGTSSTRACTRKATAALQAVPTSRPLPGRARGDLEPGRDADLPGILLGVLGHAVERRTSRAARARRRGVRRLLRGEQVFAAQATWVEE